MGTTFDLASYANLNEIDNKKQRTSIMANYIHSLDLYIMLKFLENAKFSAVCIHDCWGVPYNKKEEATNLIKDIYIKIGQNGINYHYRQIRKYVVEVAGEDSAKNLDDYFKEKVRIGDLDLEMLKYSQYIINL